MNYLLTKICMPAFPISLSEEVLSPNKAASCRTSADLLIRFTIRVLPENKLIFFTTKTSSHFISETAEVTHPCNN